MFVTRPCLLSLLWIAGCGADDGADSAGPDTTPRTGVDAALADPVSDAEPVLEPQPDAAAPDLRLPEDSSVPDAAAPVPDAAVAEPGCDVDGERGAEVGQVLPDLALVDCDGNAFALSDLCPRSVGYVFEFAGWCPPCRRFAAGADALYDRFAEAGGPAFEMFVVVSQDDDGDAADAAFCQSVRAQYGLTMPVLFSPAGAFPSALDVPPNEVHLVTRRGGRVEHADHYGGDTIEAALVDAFEAEGLAPPR